MLVELQRVLSNSVVNSELIDKRNLMLVTKITNSATDGRSVDALMFQLVAVQQDDSLGILETHHSVVTMEMFKLHEWDKSGMETIQLTKLFETMIQELEGKFRAHTEAVKAKLTTPVPGLITNFSINQTNE